MFNLDKKSLLHDTKREDDIFLFSSKFIFLVQSPLHCKGLCTRNINLDENKKISPSRFVSCSDEFLSKLNANTLLL